AALERERRRLLLLGATEINALLDVDRASFGGAEYRIARRHAAHRGRGVAVAVRTRLVGFADFAFPQRLAVEHRERCRVGGVVVLHRFGGGRHLLVARAALVERDFGEREGHRAARDCGDRSRKPQLLYPLPLWVRVASG